MNTNFYFCTSQCGENWLPGVLVKESSCKVILSALEKTYWIFEDVDVNIIKVYAYDSKVLTFFAKIKSYV